MPVTRRQLNYDFVRDGLGQGFLDSLFTFGRASSATRINASGVLETVGSHVPRFDFDPVTLQCRGLLLEESRTNLLLHSGDLTNAVWLVSGSASVSGDTITDGTAEVESAIRQQLTIPNDSNTYTFSVELKAGPNGLLTQLYTSISGGSAAVQAYVNLLWTAGVPSFQAVVGGTGTITPVGDGWYRITYTASNNSTGNTALASYIFPVLTASYTGSVRARRPQLEVGSFATSYIPTTGAAATRAVEYFYTSLLDPWVARSGGMTIMADYTPNLGSPNFPVVARLAPNLYLESQNNGAVGLYVDATPLVGATVATTLPVKAAASLVQGRGAIATNGGNVVAASRNFIVPDQLVLGAYNSAGAHSINGHLRRFIYLPFAVDDYTLKALTQ